MKLTEDEASKVTCPETLINHGDSESQNCIGSRCMAWRWCGERWERNKAGERIRAKDDLGYCGIAGKPDWT